MILLLDDESNMKFMKARSIANVLNCSVSLGERMMQALISLPNNLNGVYFRLLIKLIQ